MILGKLILCLKSISLSIPSTSTSKLHKRISYSVKLSHTKHRSKTYSVQFNRNATGNVGEWFVCNGSIPDTFPLDITFNALLFSNVYVDVWEEGMLFGRKHLGRIEVRLADLFTGGNEWSGRWRLQQKQFAMYKKQHTPSTLSIWHLSKILDRGSMAVGCLYLDIWYEPKEIVGSLVNLVLAGNEEEIERDSSIARVNIIKSTVKDNNNDLLTTILKSSSNSLADLRTIKDIEEINQKESSSSSDDTNYLMEGAASDSLAACQSDFYNENYSDNAIQSAALTEKSNTISICNANVPSNSRTPSLSTGNLIVTASERGSFIGEYKSTQSLQASTFYLQHNETISSIESVMLTEEERTMGTFKRFQRLVSLFNQGIKLSTGKVVSGFMLLQSFHRSLPHSLPYEQLPSDSSYVQLAKQCWPFCLSAFGWKGIAFCNKTKNASFLLTFPSNANKKAILQYLKIPADALIRLEMDAKREQFAPAFLLAIDAKTNSLVLAIRGTCDWEDTNTDLACEYVPFYDGFVHQGIYQAARWLIRNVLADCLHTLREKQIKNFIVTGHSLGGAIGTMFCILAREEMKNRGDNEKRLLQNLKCCTFGSPPSISRSIAERIKKGSQSISSTTSTTQFQDAATDSYIVNFIYGADLIPSLCYGSVLDFKQMLLCAAGLMRKMDWLRMGTSLSGNKENHAILQECRQLLKGTGRNEKLFLPGDIIHVSVEKSEGGRENKIVVRKGDVEWYGELVLKRNCFSDHLPTSYNAMVENLK